MQENILNCDIFRDGVFGKTTAIDKNHMDRYLLLKKSEKKYLENTVTQNPLTEIFALKALQKMTFQIPPDPKTGSCPYPI